MSARPAPEAPEIPDLAALRGDDESRAQGAFERLWGAVRPSVLRQLARRDVLGDEAEDVAQDVAARLWRLRKSVDARTVGAWFSLVRKATLRNLADRWASRERTVDLDEADIPSEDVPFLDAVVTAALERRRIFDAADDLWLGEPAEPADAEIGAAALVLVLADGVPAEEAAVMFGVETSAIDRWLKDPAVVSRAVYAALCWSSDELAGHVLRPDFPLSSGELDGVSSGEADPALEGWTTGEARAVCWRVRNGLETDQIVRVASGALDESRVDDVLRRARGAYPFRARARALLQSLSERGRTDGLSDMGLWRRVAFEYHARYSLARDHIVERAGPAAEEAGVRFGATVLDNWLSRGRLYAQLATRLQEAE